MDDSFKARYYGLPMIDASQGYRLLMEREARLIQVSGFDMDKLIELFAAGYTLQPPPKSISMEDLADQFFIKGDFYVKKM